MKRISILASGAACSLLVALVAQGCSSAEEDPDPVVGQGGTGGQVGGGQGGAAAPAAGAGGTALPGTGGTASSGTGGSPAGGQGGLPAAGGAGGSTAAGAGGTSTAEMGSAGMGIAGMGSAGTGGAPDPSALCVGVNNNQACTVTCTDQCGVFNLGARLCTCTNLIASCVTCEFAVEDPLIIPPTAAFPACLGADGMPATDTVMEGLDQGVGYTCVADTRCEPSGEPDRYCGCRDNEWDCDSKPDSFTF